MEKYYHFDRRKSLQELDGKRWEDTGVMTTLIKTCHELRKKPVGLFTTEELRIMIGQAIGLDYLMPLALETLDDCIFTEGSLHSGDLLDAVLKVDSSFWRNNPVYKEALEDILERNIADLNEKLCTFRQKTVER